MTPTAAAHRRTLDRPVWLSDDVWPFDPYAVRVDGQLLHYIDAGRGPTLLFVTAGTWSFVWRDVIELLTRDFRCLALDFPHAGLSDASPSFVVGLAAHSRLLEAFADALCPDRVVLVAHDLGGPIGLAMAIRRPQRIAGLVLTQTFAWPPDHAVLKAMLGLMGSAPMREFATLTELIPRLTATSFGVGRHLKRNERAAFRGPFRDPAKRRAFHRLMRSARRSNELLAEIATSAGPAFSQRPALTVFGERNDPLGFQARWLQVLPHARQVVVPGANHFPMNDDPALFADSIRDWWQANPALSQP